MRNKSILKLTQTSILLAIALVFQMVGSRFPGINQYIVGSMINAVLLLTTYICGTFYGAAIAVLTLWTALLAGQLKPALAPFIPFIMLGNLILVLCFGVLCGKGNLGKYIGVIMAAAAKFIFLYLSAVKLIFVFKLSIPAPAVKALSVSMGITQLFTALIGGILALGLIKLLSNKISISNIKSSAL
jgi:hypothetical protein